MPVSYPTTATFPNVRPAEITFCSSCVSGFTSITGAAGKYLAISGLSGDHYFWCDTGTETDPMVTGTGHVVSVDSISDSDAVVCGKIITAMNNVGDWTSVQSFAAMTVTDNATGTRTDASGNAFSGIVVTHQGS